jgi:hypothetical protein
MLIGVRRGARPSGHLAVVLGVLTIALSACAAGQSEAVPDQGGSSPSTAVAPISQRIRTAYPTFSWPTKYRLDLTKYLGSYPADAAFAPGYEVTALASVNECAWLNEYLDARSTGSQARQSSAIKQFKVATTREVAVQSLRQFYLQLEQTATSGDSALAARYVNLNCRGLPFQGRTR